MRYDQVLEEIEPKHRVWNAAKLEYEFVGDPIDPIASYKVCDMDDTGATKYYGYADRHENWYIMELTDTTVRYIKGSGTYVTNWNGRTLLVYDYFFNVF